MMAHLKRWQVWISTTVLATGLVFATACDRLRDQPAPKPEPAPALEDLRIALSDSGHGQVPLPSSLVLASGALNISYGTPNYGTLTADLQRQQVYYTEGPTFTTGDTATYTVARAGTTHTGHIYIAVGQLCRPVARLDTFSFLQPVVGPQALNILLNDASCANVRIQLETNQSRPSRFSLHGNQVFFQTDTYFSGQDSVYYTLASHTGFISKALIKVRLKKTQPPSICTTPFQAPVEIIYYTRSQRDSTKYEFRKPILDILIRATHCPDDTIDYRTFVSAQGQTRGTPSWRDDHLEAHIDTVTRSLVGTIDREPHNRPAPQVLLSYQIRNRARTKLLTSFIVLRKQP